ncbi:MAG TPA: coenzyme F420-0:L-glutamate ligase [Candidatus Saccharimonadales bacterium]|nr:coenzyme F420-0:L-glutamate ligase [Candidatus Saccharimonadales bacterium]
MNVAAIRTAKVEPSAPPSIIDFLDVHIPKLTEGSVVAIASKVVAICEGRVAPIEGNDKDELIKKETALYLPRESNPFHVTLSVTHNLLVAAGGIDESNSGDYYVLWPKDKQASANAIRGHLAQKHNLTNVGVVITDSTTRPFQWGTTGLGIAHSGFKALKNYIGTQDIFGRQLQFQQNNIMNGLAAAAVLLMGEGNEQQPLAIISDVPFVEFVPHNPTQQELDLLSISIEEDIYQPLLQNVPWLKGDQQ